MEKPPRPIELAAAVRSALEAPSRHGEDSLKAGARVRSIDAGARISLVTHPQLGHSYPINPGFPATGTIVTTSFIVVPHFAQDGLASSLSLVSATWFGIRLCKSFVWQGRPAHPSGQRTGLPLVITALELRARDFFVL